MIAKISNKTVLFAALTAAMMLSLPMMGIEATVQESREEQELAKLHDTSRLDPTSEKFFDLIKRDELSNTEIEQAKNIMRSNDGLRQMIDNGLLETMSVSFVGNANTLPVKWYPVINMADGMEITSVKLDLGTNEILNMTTYKSHELHHSNAYAVDEYFGSPSLVKGITVTSENQPMKYDGNDTYSGYSALLLNAKMYGSIRDNLCSAAHFPSHYWLQVGTQFNEVGWLYVYADTTTNCASRVLELPKPSATNDINYKIYSGSTWYVVLHNEDKNDFAYYPKSGLNSGWIQRGDESTGVFFENGYTGSGWDSQFVDGDLSRTDAQVQRSDGSWVNWSGNTQYILDCNGNVQTDDVISGTLSSGRTATWDISEMTDWPNC